MAANGNNGRRYPGVSFSAIPLTYALRDLSHRQDAVHPDLAGYVIGTASLILVVTIGLTGKQYLLQQIQNIGSNMMVAEYAGGGIYGRDASSDFLTLDDLTQCASGFPASAMPRP